MFDNIYETDMGTLTRVPTPGSPKKSPQTVKVVKSYSFREGTHSFLVKTWLGDKWIEPLSETYEIVQD